MSFFSIFSSFFTSKQKPIPDPQMSTTTSQNQDAGLALVKQFEGCRLTAYQDIVGVWTIGYGETQNVHPGMTITQEQADEMVKTRYEEFQNKVKALLHVGVTQNQLGALTSFAYNLGVGSLANSTLLRLLNQGQPASVVAEQFGKWVMAGGKVVQGLVSRRSAEAKLFLTP